MCRPHPGATALVAILALQAGCTWVSSKDVDGLRGQVDDDQDGFVASVDCDEANPNINPGATETWYDGIDQDCAGDDDYDADADGYVIDLYLGLATNGVTDSGALPGGDCNDLDAGANPGQSDAWYDGVDTNCDGLDDYDQDGDGFVPVGYEGLHTTNAPGTGNLPQGDCDDTVAGVHPGLADAWYDGIDTDCAGNDDFDTDADGYVRDADAGTPTTYVDGSGALPTGDCNDSNNLIFPGATDTWYDGIDSDCASDDDFDKDLDGHRHPFAPKGSGDDCNDDDATSYPGHVELLGDGIDHDCDGDPNRFVLASLPSMSWTAPHDMRFDENSSKVYLSVAAQQITYGASNFYDSVVALTWNSTDPFPGSDGLIAWLQNLTDPTFSLTGGQGFYATDAELIGAVGLTYTSTGYRALRLGGYDLDTFVRFGVNSPSTSWAAFQDIAVDVDGDGKIQAVGCEATDGVGRYMRATRAGLATTYETTEEVPDLPAAVCTLHFFDAPWGTVVSAQPAGLVSTPFNPTAATPFADLAACPPAAAPPPIAPGSGSATGDTGTADTGTADTGTADTGTADTGTTDTGTTDTGTTDTGTTDTGTTDTGGGDTGASAPCNQGTADPTIQASHIQAVPDRPWLLVSDVANDAIVLIDSHGTETLIPVVDPMYAQATVGPDNTIYIAYVDGTGTPGLAWGTVLAGFSQVVMDPGFTTTEAAVEVTASGGALLFSALGHSDVIVGTVSLE